MQTASLYGLQNILHPKKEKQTATERIMNNLSHSSYGLLKNEHPAAIDSFQITENISELLSPACGMTEEEKQCYLQKILAKLKSGKALTAEEMRFLQAEYPALYQQAARVQAMRSSLENRLKSASSKEEAQTIFTDAMSSVSDEDPMKEYIIAAYQNVMDEFEQSDEYSELPQEDREEA